jgi:transglutaminase-like putative cysteine protease
MTRTWRGSVGLFMLSASISVALSRLITHGVRFGVIAPMVLAILVADQGVALVMRWRLSMVPAIGVGTALSLLALLVGFDPSLFNPASAHFADFHYLSSQFRSARNALANDGTPLPSLGGVVVAIGALGGLAASATRGIWESQLRRERPGRHIGPLTGCVAPSLGVFVYSTLVSANHGRTPAAVTYFAGVAVFVALSDHTDGLPWRHLVRRLPAGSVAVGALVLAMVLVAGAGLSGMRLSVFHVTPPTAAAQGAGNGLSAKSPAQVLTGTALIDDLRAVEINESNTVIFTAHSAVPTYWQVGVLTSYDGSQWLPNVGVQGALAGDSSVTPSSLGGTGLPIPSNGTTFASRLHITDFASRLLPSPPHTLSVAGVAGAIPVGQEGVLAPTSSRPGTTYSATAQLIPTHPASTTQLPLDDPRLAPYLALPSLPIVVPFLAHEAVGKATTQGAEVQALVDWFRTPGRFRYTLDPPATTGSDALVQFLTVTRAGYCQQFAGAFAILSRALGIPTRLVVGFIAGTPGSGNSYTITGADAHVWPQVYLGPGTGWVSVEPTPPAPNDTTTPAGVVGPTPPSATTQTTQVPTGAGTTTTATTVVPSQGGTTSQHRSPGGSSWWIVPVIVVVAAALASGAFIVWRRRNARTDVGASPDQRIVREWNRAQLALRRRGLGPRAAETPLEYAARVERYERRAASRVGAEALGRLAHLVQLACYMPQPCTAGEAEAARGLAAEVREANRRGRPGPATS